MPDEPAKIPNADEPAKTDTESAVPSENPQSGAKPSKIALSGAKPEKSAVSGAKPAKIAQTIRIHTDYITLQDLLKLAGAVDTGGEAKIRIQNCEAEVNGSTCTQRGKKLRPGDFVSFRDHIYTVGHGR